MEPKIRFDCSTALRAAPVRCTFDQQMTSEWMKNWCLSRWCCVGVRERRARGFSSRKRKETNDTHALQTHTCITQRTLYKYYHDHNQFSHHTAIAIHLFVRNGKKKNEKRPHQWQRQQSQWRPHTQANQLTDYTANGNEEIDHLSRTKIHPFSFDSNQKLWKCRPLFLLPWCF